MFCLCYYNNYYIWGGKILKDEGAEEKMEALKNKVASTEDECEALRMETKNLKRQIVVLEGALLMVLNPSIYDCSLSQHPSCHFSSICSSSLALTNS